jgi:PAS domain S-box-containing protein
LNTLISYRTFFGILFLSIIGVSFFLVPAENSFRKTFEQPLADLQSNTSSTNKSFDPQEILRENARHNRIRPLSNRGMPAKDTTATTQKKNKSPFENISGGGYSGQEMTRIIAGIALAALLLLAALSTWSWRLYRNLNKQSKSFMLSQKRYRTLVESLDDGLCVFDENCCITYLNETTCRIHGTRYEELLGQKVSDMFPAELPENRKIMESLRNIGDDDTKAIETTITTKGKTVSILVTPHSFSDELGNPNGGYLLIRDITEHRKTEQALYQSEKTFSAVFENSPAAISLRDTDGKYRLANKQFLRWFGLSQSEIIGETVDTFLPPHRAEQARNDDQWVLMVGEVLEREFQLAGPNPIQVSVTKFPVRNRDDEIIGVGTIMVDVSREREAESKLRQSQKMEVVGQLTGGISHDFNNLLTIINGNLELSLETIEDPELRGMLQDAKNAALLGADVTHRLLSFSSTQALNPVDADLNSLVKELLPLMNTSLGEAITIKRVREENLWPCKVDIAQIQNAILNLAVNARDAMPSGGELVITTRNTLLQDTKQSLKHGVLPGEYVMISVSDEGCGMSKDVLERVYEPFFTTKGSGKGTGLGLSMVYGFTRQSGGYMTIDSTEGVGTTVCLYLARLQTAYKPSKPDLMEQEQTSNLRANAAEKVLIVEDHPNVRKLSRRFLNELGYTTLEAEDGHQALEILRSESGINLLFTDAVLPGGISGIDIARDAQSNVPGIKILITTGYSEEFLESYSRTKAEFQRLNKPFGKYELAKRLRGLLDNEPASPS